MSLRVSGTSLLTPSISLLVEKGSSTLSRKLNAGMTSFQIHHRPTSNPIV